MLSMYTYIEIETRLKDLNFGTPWFGLVAFWPKTSQLGQSHYEINFQFHNNKTVLGGFFFLKIYKHACTSIQYTRVKSHKRFDSIVQN